jgi:hypothetical protein
VSQAFPNEISNGVEIKYVDRRTVSFTKNAQLSVTSDEKGWDRRGIRALERNTSGCVRMGRTRTGLRLQCRSSFYLS